MVNGVPLAPYFGPYEEVVQRACPVCGERTLTIDTSHPIDGPRLLCCRCGAWGDAWSDDFISPGVTNPGDRAWISLQNYTKRVADELAAD